MSGGGLPPSSESEVAVAAAAAAVAVTSRRREEAVAIAVERSVGVAFSREATAVGSKPGGGSMSYSAVELQIFRSIVEEGRLEIRRVVGRPFGFVVVAQKLCCFDVN